MVTDASALGARSTGPGVSSLGVSGSGVSSRTGHASLIDEIDAAMYRNMFGYTAFGPVYQHVLRSPGKRVRAGLVLACSRLTPSRVGVSDADAVDLAAAIEMLHESSLIHDDICDGSVLRRDKDSVAAAFGVRTAARAGFHLAGTALRIVARVIEDNPEVFARIGQASGVTYLDGLSELSFGQLIEILPPDLDDAALRRHYRAVAGAKTGTLFRVACAYGGTAGGLDDDRLRSLMTFADELAMAFQVMDDVRDIEGGPRLGKDACGDLDRRVPTWPVIEWLAREPAAKKMWSTESVPGRDLRSELVRSGALDQSRLEAERAVRNARAALEVFWPSPALDRLLAQAARVMLR